ncbi:MAG TPA: CehA/McbA family metallohydrolase [Gaiellaceae bacterium]|nr:CehA/McbA family metallohydrolase [Gaiellaceae bacterium]
MLDPFLAEGEWLRCALHAHTTRSDGELAPEALAAHYARAGYDVLAITDHWKRTGASADGLLVLASIELNCVLPAGRDGHVLGFGVDAEPAELGSEYAGLERTAEWIEEHGGVAYLAHPYWTGVVPGELELPANVPGIEVFNAGCELEVGRGLSSVHWDELLEAGARCFAIATDDSHHPGFDSDLAWSWLRVVERTREGVLDALRAGRYYSTAGPVIHGVELDGDALDVRCSPCRSVLLVARRERGAAVHAGRVPYCHRGQVLERADDGSITRARLELASDSDHVRVELVDNEGRKAWTNPLWR